LRLHLFTSESWPILKSPLLHSTIENSHVLGTVVSEHPRAARNREHSLVIVADDVVVGVDVEFVHLSLENVQGWHRVGQVGSLSHHLVMVEKLSVRCDAGFQVLGLAVSRIVRHVPSRVNNAEVAVLSFNKRRKFLSFDEILCSS